MDAKITKKRLNILLSYDWIKIILVAVAAIVAWSLIFTTTATRLTSAQQFTVFNYLGSSPGSRFGSYGSLLKEKGVLSYEILEAGSTDVSDPQYTSTLLQTRFSVREGDAIFAADVVDEESTYADFDGNEFHPTYLETFLYGYYSYAVDVEKYLSDMEEYLDGYYGGDLTSGEADEAKIEADFRARIKKNKDKRFKKEAKIREGVQKEFARIEGYRQSYLEFGGYLDPETGCVELTEKTLYLQSSSTGEKKAITGKFGINLCPDERMSKLKQDVYYYKTVPVEGGAEDETQKVPTAENMNIVLLDFKEESDEYTRWEGLSFVNYLIKTNFSEEI